MILFSNMDYIAYSKGKIMGLLDLYEQINHQEWIDIPEGWSQGRTLYGGLAAAMMIQKAFATVGDLEKKLLTTSITFVGPIEISKVRLTAEVLREGKSVTSVEVRLWQNNAVQTILLASFGLPRASEIEVHQERQAPSLTVPNEQHILPVHPLAPECMQQMQLIWAAGQLPCSASSIPDFTGWMRFCPSCHENRAMTPTDLVLAFDMWPPGVLPMFKKMAPASSLTWTITFVHSVETQLQDWMKYKVFTDMAHGGYATEYAHLWDKNDRLIAIARQTVTVFA